MPIGVEVDQVPDSSDNKQGILRELAYGYIEWTCHSLPDMCDAIYFLIFFITSSVITFINPGLYCQKAKSFVSW